MIRIYTTRTCAQCPLVINFMKMKNQEYEKVDVTDDASKREWLQKQTGYSTVPVTIREGYIPVVGYSPTALSQLI